MPVGCWAGPRNNTKQFLLVGPEGSGKTAFLYLLKIAQWNKNDFIKDAQKIKDDYGYHYEEFTKGPWPYGIWDIPGSDYVRPFIGAFYRYLQMDAVLYMVDANELVTLDYDQLECIRTHFHYLLHEDELRSCSFTIIANTKGENTSHTPDKEEVSELFGLPHELRPQDRSRVICTVFDAGKINEQSNDWREILEHVRMFGISIMG